MTMFAYCSYHRRLDCRKVEGHPDLRGKDAFSKALQDMIVDMRLKQARDELLEEERLTGQMSLF